MLAHSLSTTLRTALIALPLVWLASACGIGAAGAAAGVSDSGDDTAPSQGNLLRGQSSPPLMATQPQEPLAPGPQDPNAPVSGEEPTKVITLRFSDPIAQSVTADKFTVSIKRPMGDFFEVAIEEVMADGTTVQIVLARTTLLNSMYRVSVGSLTTDAGASVTGTGDSFFIVRDGTWSEPETIATGGDLHGGIALTEDFNGYATIEGLIGDPNSPEVWLEAITSARFGNPWQFPTYVFARTTTGAESRVQLNTGGLVLNNEVGFFRISEGEVNESDASDMEVVMRAPVGELTTFNGLDFGDLVMVDSLANPTGRIDLGGDAMNPVIPEFLPGAPHFTFPGQFVHNGPSVAAAFWGISDAQDVGGANVFVTQRVYANDVTKIANSSSWSDWGTAKTISAPGIDHNSWPVVTQSDDGVAYALWWSADTTDGIFDETVGQYWMSTWTAGSEWSDAIEVTPTGETGHLPITDVHVIERDGMERRLLVFFRSPSGPVAREFDPPTPAAPTNFSWFATESPVATFTIPQIPTANGFEGYNVTDSSGNRNYKRLRSQLGSMTPLAEPIGANQFLVRWVEDTPPIGGDATVILGVFRADDSPRWSTDARDNADLSSIALVEANRPHRSNVGLSVDPNGWATIVWRQPDTAGLEQSIARRTNLVVDGAEGLLDPASERQITPSIFEAVSPSLSATHSSGSVILAWVVRAPELSFFLGSAASRFR